MRIIGGELKRRKLRSPPASAETRPLPDGVRESLFTLLRGHWEGATVFDGFAGTGSFGLEAVSRGAGRVVMVERDRAVARVLGQSAEDLGIEGRVEIVQADALGPLAVARCPNPVHVAFLDPPFAMCEDEAGWDRIRGQMARLVGLLDAEGYAMVRTPSAFSGDLAIEGGEGPETHVYRRSAVHLYMRA